MEKVIDKFRGEYAFLSNFAPCKVTYNGRTYKTVEHAFQAAKSLDPDIRWQFQYCRSAGEAKQRGKMVKLRPDWEEIKDKVMLTGLRKKFTDPELRSLLLATGDEELIEGNYWGDTYWGVCNGAGQNKLGKLLMQVREEIKNNA